MEQKTLMHSSILAAIFIAAVIGASMVNGFPGAKPFISVDPVSDKNVGEQFTITGTTNLPAGSEIMVDIHPSSLDLNTGMVSDPKTGAAMRLDGSMVVTGMFTVDKNPDGIATWSFDVPSAKFLTGEYTAIVFVYNKNKPGPGDISGVTKFTVKQGPATPVTGQFIRIDPVGDKNIGDTFAITGTTNLPAGSEILFQVYPLSFVPDSTNPQTGAQSGMFTGATGTVAVKQGTGDTNTWSADLDLSTFQSMEYLVNVSLFTGGAGKGDYSTGSPSGTTTFAVHPASGTAGTSQSPGRTVAGGILIDPIHDTPSGTLLEVTGGTNLSVGTDLLVKVVPVITQNGKLTGDYQHPENVMMTKVVKGPGVNNRFSVYLDTRLLPVTDHIVTVSSVKGNAAGIDSEPGVFTGSQIFNILAGTTNTGDPKYNTSAPAVFINYIDDVTAGDPITVTGTTNLPVGAKFQVSVIPEDSSDFKHPEFSATISVVKGSATANLFSVNLPTKNLPPGQHILTVSAYDYETTGTILFTIKNVK
jgi:hypothetical protein